MSQTKLNSRSLTQIFQEASICGTENVFCNDTETGKVLAGSDSNTVQGSTIANKRSRGELNIPFYKAGREARYKLSDLLAYRDKNLKRYA